MFERITGQNSVIFRQIRLNRAILQRKYSNLILKTLIRGEVCPNIMSLSSIIKMHEQIFLLTLDYKSFVLYLLWEPDLISAQY